MRLERFPPQADVRHRRIPEDRIIAMLLLAGWAFEIESGGLAQALVDTKTALETWIKMGLGYRDDGRGRRLFDPVEVFNILKWAGLAGRDPFWIDRFVRTGRALVTDFALTVGAGGDRLSAADPPTGFTLALSRRFDLRRFAKATALRLRMPLPLRGPTLDALVVTPTPCSAPGAETTVSEGRLEVRLPAPDYADVRIGAVVRFVATARDTALSDAALSPDERAIYLRPVEGLVRVTTTIRDLAARLAGTTSPLATVDTFWSYMLDCLICGSVRYDAVDPDAPGDWVLQNGWYDCQLGSALLVSLCRARGIPARVIGGHLLYRLAPTNHFWAEIWIEGHGWLPFDVLSWDLSIGGTDPVWRNHFARRVDHRMVTQCLPHAFTGSMSVRLPAAWQMVQERSDDGMTIVFSDVTDGSLVYSDHISVRREAGVPS